MFYTACIAHVVRLRDVQGPLNASPKENALALDDFYHGQITWAPDGERLVATTGKYPRVGNDVVLRMQTWQYNTDDSGQNRLPIPETHEVLDWSADGRFLLTFVPLRTQPRAERLSFPHVLYTMRPDGTDAKQITPDGLISGYGRISPDSENIESRDNQ